MSKNKAPTVMVSASEFLKHLVRECLSSSYSLTYGLTSRSKVYGTTDMFCADTGERNW